MTKLECLSVIIIALICSMFCDTAQAQNWYYPNWYSSPYYYPTPNRTYFYWYYNAPTPTRRYLSPSEIRERWYLQDEYKARNKTENALDRKERMMDQAERAYEIEKRENDLIHKGILPPRKPRSSVFFHNGVEYNSFDDYKESSAYYEENKQKELLRIQTELEKKYEKERDNAYLQMWHQMGDIGKEQFGRLNPLDQENQISEFMRTRNYKHE